MNCYFLNDLSSIGGDLIPPLGVTCAWYTDIVASLVCIEDKESDNIHLKQLSHSSYVKKG